MHEFFLFQLDPSSGKCVLRNSQEVSMFPFSLDRLLTKPTRTDALFPLLALKVNTILEVRREVHTPNVKMTLRTANQ